VHRCCCCCCHLLNELVVVNFAICTSLHIPGGDDLVTQFIGSFIDQHQYDCEYLDMWWQ
jgi:hypothetical protein